MIPTLRLLPPLLVLALLAGCSGCGDRAPAVHALSAADAGATPSAPEVARLRELSGAVTLERAGQRRAARPEPLFARDAVETGVEASAVIGFPDGRSVELGPNARLVLNEDQTGLMLEIQRGVVLSRVPRDAKPAAGGQVAIRILTPFGLTRVGGGESEVQVAVTGDDARVDVKIGQVELVARNGETTRATAGDSLQVSAGQVQVLARAGEVLMLEPIRVTLVADGRAELRRQGATKWVAVGRQGAALGEGDAVRVRKGSSTLALAGSGSTFTLAPGAQLRFEKSGRGGGAESSEVMLERGTLRLQLAGDRRSKVVVGGLELRSASGGSFEVVRTGHGFTVSARAGELSLVHGDSQGELSPGQVAEVADREGPIQISSAEPPELVLPSRFGLHVFHPGVAGARLDWRGGDGDYLVKVAEDARFERLVASGRVHQSEVAVPIPRRGALYWEVRDPRSGAEVDSGSAVFAPEPRHSELERLRNEVPEGAEKTTIYYQDKPPAVTFTWRGEPGAAKYRVAVFKVGELDHPVAERDAAEARAALEAGALGEGSYVWSVTPLSGAGEAMRGGRMNKLELVYDNSVPTLLIQSPKNGDRARGRVQAKGVAPVGARLFVNGRELELDPKSRFDAPVPVSGARPLVIFRLVRPNAADAFYVRTLKRARG